MILTSFGLRGKEQNIRVCACYVNLVVSGITNVRSGNRCMSCITTQFHPVLHSIHCPLCIYILLACQSSSWAIYKIAGFMSTVAVPLCISRRKPMWHLMEENPREDCWSWPVIGRAHSARNTCYFALLLLLLRNLTSNGTDVWMRTRK